MTSNWDASIRKVPLSSNDGIKSTAWAVQREDMIETKTETTVINAPIWNEVGIVSNKYLLIPNKQVVELANDIADNSGLKWTEDKTFWNGKQFMYSLVAKDYTEEVSIGDDVALGMMFWNSYDGSTSLQFRLYLQRLVCLNGMVSNDVFKAHKFKHSHASEGYQDEIIEASKIITTSENRVRYFINALRHLTNDEMDMENLALLRDKYFPKLPSSLFGKIMDKLLNYRPNGKPTTYDFLNSATNLLWHKKKQTKADFDHNAYIVDSLIEYSVDVN